MKLNQKERNFITVLIAILAAIFILILFEFYSEKKKKKKTPKLDIHRERIRTVRIRELISKGDQIQKDRYQLKKYKVIRHWVEKKTNQFLLVFRWSIFGVVFSVFLLTWIFPETTIGFSTDDVLKVISVSVILFVLLFFASSEKNDSLKKCYQRIQPATFKLFMYLVRKFHKTPLENQLHLKDKKALLDELKAKYEALVPIMDELRRIDKGGFYNPGPFNKD